MSTPTLAQLERRVRRAAMNLDRVSVKRLESCAAIVHFTKGEQTASIDGHQVGLVAGLIHEAVHVACALELSTWGALEERVADVAEHALYEYVRNRPRLWKSWCALVDNKVEGL